MPFRYTIYAARKLEKKRLPCASAWDAVQQRSLLIQQGWGVSISDHQGIPIADCRMAERAKAEADTAAGMI